MDQNTGTLSLQNLFTESGINIPRSFVISPSGKVMVIANQNGGSIMVSFLKYIYFYNSTSFFIYRNIIYLKLTWKLECHN